jgi:hypothetical protein
MPNKIPARPASSRKKLKKSCHYNRNLAHLALIWQYVATSDKMERLPASGGLHEIEFRDFAEPCGRREKEE